MANQSQLGSSGLPDLSSLTRQSPPRASLRYPNLSFQPTTAPNPDVIPVHRPRLTISQLFGVRWDLHNRHQVRAASGDEDEDEDEDEDDEDDEDDDDGDDDGDDDDDDDDDADDDDDDDGDDDDGDVEDEDDGLYNVYNEFEDENDEDDEDSEAEVEFNEDEDVEETINSRDQEEGEEEDVTRPESGQYNADEALGNIQRAENEPTMDIDRASHNGATPQWKGQLPPMSRAFEALSGDAAADRADSGLGAGYFEPSYLRGSAYMRRLRQSLLEQAKAKNEARTSSAQPLHGDSLTSGMTSLRPGSHRGISHTVIERAQSPVSESDSDAVPPLPSRWAREPGSHGGLEVTLDGMMVKFSSGARSYSDREHEASAIRADHPMPAECGLYYFEVTILGGRQDDTPNVSIAVGFSTHKTSLSRLPGWEPESWGYHGDDGRCYVGSNVGKSFGAQFDAGDVIGCGVNFRLGTAFFTKNGNLVEPTLSEVRGELYPSVGLKKHGEAVKVNFGQSPFVYNIDRMMHDEKQLVEKEIAAFSPLPLMGTMNELDFAQTLILQTLRHGGHLETAGALADEIAVQNASLNPGNTLDSDIATSAREDADAVQRRIIRKAVLDGEIDSALKFTNDYYPNALTENPQIHFRLRCRKFIEMVRRISELTTGASPVEGERAFGNGFGAHGATSAQEMDLDGMDTDAPVPDRLGLEAETLEYGKKLKAKFGEDSNPEVSKALEELWSLLAYEHPLKQPKVSHLLDKECRVALAEELNAAILSFRGRSPRSALEQIWVQTSVLLEELREHGGPGAFVTLKDVVGRISKEPSP